MCVSEIMVKDIKMKFSMVALVKTQLAGQRGGLSMFVIPFHRRNTLTCTLFKRCSSALVESSPTVTEICEFSGRSQQWQIARTHGRTGSLSSVDIYLPSKVASGCHS